MDSYNVIANQPVVIDNVSADFWCMFTSQLEPASGLFLFFTFRAVLIVLQLKVKVSNTSGAGNCHLRDLQTTANYVRKAEKNFLPEMQSKVTTICDNPSGTEYKTWGRSCIFTTSPGNPIPNRS